MKFVLTALMLFVAAPAWAQARGQSPTGTRPAAPAPAPAQAPTPDLDRLKERATALWADRKNANTTRAATYVAPTNTHPVPAYGKVVKATVESFDITEDAKVVVSTKVTMIPAGSNEESTTTVKETWVFARNNWFLTPEAPPAPSGEATAKKTVLPAKFEILDKTIDLGSHKQGEVVTGTVRFKAPRVRVEIIRVQGVAGLQMRRIEWADDTGGTIHIALDTLSLTEDLNNAVVVFDPVNALAGLPNPLTPDIAALKVRIQGKVRIVQLPQTDKAKRENLVEVEIRNLGDTRFKVENVRSVDAVSFDGEEALLPPLEPGESAILPVYYKDPNGPGDAELTFRFSPGLLPNNFLYFRMEPLKAQGKE
jgi:hypothetical protein